MGKKASHLRCPGKHYKTAMWGQRSPSLGESSHHSQGLILSNPDISNTRIKIEAPEGFGENKTKGENSRGNTEFAGEAK